MQITCNTCGTIQDINPAAIIGANGGKKSKRTITPEQRAVMQAAKNNKKGNKHEQRLA